MKTGLEGCCYAGPVFYRLREKTRYKPPFCQADTGVYHKNPCASEKLVPGQPWVLFCSQVNSFCRKQISNNKKTA